MIKKLFFALLITGAAGVAEAALPTRYVQISTATITRQSGTAVVAGVDVSTVTASSATLTNVNASSGTVRSFMVVGTATNDSAPVGRLGEVIECSGTGTITNAGGNCCSISLTAGHWVIGANATYNGAGGSNSQHIGISLNTGSFSGTQEGFTSQWGAMNSTSGVGGTSLASISMKFTSTTTVYHVCQQGDASKAGGWSMTAVRIR